MAFSCQVDFPRWAQNLLADWQEPFDSDQAVMRLALALASENVRRGSGGPFGAVVFDPARRAVVAAGVNRVTALNLSVAHAEIMAISLAQQSLETWDLAPYALTLVTTCEPCAMCYGAVPWSGIRRLVCGAGQIDAEAAGFDEGDKPAEWVQALAQRGIEVHQGVLREEAISLIAAYLDQGGEIYNAQREAGE